LRDGRVLGRVERRRRFNIEQKLAVPSEATALSNHVGGGVRHGLLPTQIHKWCRLAKLGVVGVSGASELPSFVAFRPQRA
jgi:transposase